MKLSSAQAGFIKGLGLAVLLAVTTFFADAANVEGIAGPTIAALVAAVASSIESHMKAKANGEKGLFGAVAIK